MTLLTLKKMYSWLKSYWPVPLILIVVFVVSIALRRVPLSLMQIISKRRAMHEEEVRQIEQIHSEEIDDREKALDAYQKTMDAIEEKYKEDSSALNAIKKDKIKKIVENSYNNPDELTKQLSEQMGFEIVYPKE